MNFIRSKQKCISRFYSPMVRIHNSSMIIVSQKGFFLFLWGLCTGPGVSFYRRAWGRIMLITGQKVCHQFVEVNDMRDCTSTLSKHLEQNGHSFSACASDKNSQNL